MKNGKTLQSGLEDIILKSAGAANQGIPFTFFFFFIYTASSTSHPLASLRVAPGVLFLHVDVKLTGLRERAKIGHKGKYLCSHVQNESVPELMSPDLSWVFRGFDCFIMLFFCVMFSQPVVFFYVIKPV